MHPCMRITNGRMATEAGLASKYGANLANGLGMIDHWIDEVCREFQRVPPPERCGDRLFYKDGLLHDLMLRLYRDPASEGGHTDLVLARIILAKKQRGRGYFSALLVHLEEASERIGARFIVECANPILGGKLRSTGKYVRFEYRPDPWGILLEDQSDHWLHDPNQTLKEIFLPMPTETFIQLRTKLFKMDRRQSEHFRRTITAFVDDISSKPAEPSEVHPDKV